MPFPPGFNIKNVISFVANAYGVDLKSANQLNPLGQISRPTLEAAYEYADHFAPACRNQFHTLLNFLRGLDQHGNAALRLQALKGINTTLGGAVAECTLSLARLSAFSAACLAAPHPLHGYLREFYQARNANTALSDMELIYHTAENVGYGALSLEVISAVMQNHGDHSGVTSRSIVALCYMYNSHRPNSGFAGFPQWGPGDNGNPVDNLNVHFRNHVCRQRVQPDFGVGEAVSFWADLNIQLTLAQYNQYAVSPSPQVQGCFQGALPIAGAELRKFFIYHGMENQPALSLFLEGQYAAAYSAFAIAEGQQLNRTIVHCNGTDVYISGYHNDVFVIGRFEGPQLGISSCYRPLDLAGKLQGALSNMCWPL